MNRKDIQPAEARRIVDEWEEMRPVVDNLLVDQAQLAAFSDATRSQYIDDITSSTSKIQTYIANLTLATEKSKHYPEFQKAVSQLPIQNTIVNLNQYALRLNKCLAAAGARSRLCQQITQLWQLERRLTPSQTQHTFEKPSNHQSCDQAAEIKTAHQHSLLHSSCPSPSPMPWDPDEATFDKLQGNLTSLQLHSKPAAYKLNENEIARLYELVPTKMLVTSGGLHLFEQFNTEASREERKEYRGPYGDFYQGVNLPSFDGTGEFRCFWMRFLEKANQICISDGEKLDLLRSSVSGYLIDSMSAYDMSAKGLFDAVIQLFCAYNQTADRQLQALTTILYSPQIDEDYTDLDATFGRLHSAARELQQTTGNDVRTKYDIIKKFPHAVSQSFLLKHPDALSTTPISEMVEQLQEHTRGFATQRRVELVFYEAQAQNTICPFCQEKGHRPSFCVKLNGNQDQWQRVVSQQRCHICLESDHNQSRCNGVKCCKCGGNHHTVFHKMFDVWTLKEHTRFQPRPSKHVYSTRRDNHPDRLPDNNTSSHGPTRHHFSPHIANTDSINSQTFDDDQPFPDSSPKEDEDGQLHQTEDEFSDQDSNEEEQANGDDFDETEQVNYGQDFFVASSFDESEPQSIRPEAYLPSAYFIKTEDTVDRHSQMQLLTVSIVHPSDPLVTITVDAFLDTGSSKSYMSPDLFHSYPFPDIGTAQRHIKQFHGTVTPEVHLTNIEIPGIGVVPMDVTTLAEIRVSVWKLSPADRAVIKKKNIVLEYHPGRRHDVTCSLLIGQDLINRLRDPKRNPIQLPSGKYVDHYIFGPVISGINHVEQALFQKLNEDAYRNKDLFLPYGTQTFIATTQTKRCRQIPKKQQLSARRLQRQAAAPIIESSQPCNDLSSEFRELLRKVNTDPWRYINLGIPDLEGAEAAKAANQATTHFLDTVQLVDRRLSVTLPWNNKAALLPTNKDLAISSAFTTLRKFLSNPELLRSYDKLLSKQLANGIIERVPRLDNTSAPAQIHYLLHHPVFPTASRGIQFVCDGNAKLTGHLSLNDKLHPGPSLTTPLLNVLLRARTYRNLLISRIDNSCNQLALHKDDRDAARLIWFKTDVLQRIFSSPDPSGAIELEYTQNSHSDLTEYRFCRVPYGLTSSSFLLSASIQYHVSEADIPEQLKHNLLQNYFLDKVTLGFKQLDDAMELYQDAKNLFHQISMDLCGFSSNSASVLRQLPAADRIDTKLRELHGLRWNTEANQINVIGLSKSFTQTIFDTESKPSKVEWTKQEVFGVVATIFDPLGFLAPFTLQMRLLIQDIWRQVFNWSDRIPDLLTQRWLMLISQFVAIQGKVVIPRVAILTQDEERFFSDPQVIVHVFTGASASAICVAVYLQSAHEPDRALGAQLLLSKSRLAPLRGTPPSTPKQKLLGLNLGMELAEQVVHAIQSCVRIQSVQFYSDSRPTLSQIASKEQAHTVLYVRHRVKEFREGLDRLQENYNVEVRHVPNALNTADLGTRAPASLDKTVQSGWFTGPSFLSQPSSHWPASLQKQYIIPPCDPDLQEAVSKPATAAVRMVPQRKSKTSKKKLT